MEQVEINGKVFACVEYSEDLGEVRIPATAEKILAGKPLEEQIAHFWVSESSHISKTYYGEEEGDKISNWATPLSEYEGVQKLIVKGDMLVGAIVAAYFGSRALMFGRSVCTYYVSETDGSGTNEREDYAYLLFKE